MEIPQSHPYPTNSGWSREEIKSSIDAWTVREKWTEVGMYAFVCWDWVDPLSAWIGERKVLEVMAGAGWLAKALREKGIDIIATDDHTWVKKKEWKLITEVEKLEASAAIEKYAADVDIMLISWPPYNENAAYKALVKLHEVNPMALIIYIGEYGGCTADDDFYEHFEFIEDEGIEAVSKKYKTWFGLHDSIYLGKFKTPTP